MFSPANTSTAFDEGDYAEPDLYFRTAPSDILQGAVMANLLIQDGRSNVASWLDRTPTARRSPSRSRQNLEDAGSSRRRDGLLRRERAVVRLAGRRDRRRRWRRGRADRLRGDGHDHPAARSPPVPVRRTCRPTSSTATPPTTARPDPAAADGHARGHQGHHPRRRHGGDFQDRLLEVDPDLDSFAYAAESYDAVIVSAPRGRRGRERRRRGHGAEIPGVTAEGESARTSRSASTCSGR